MKKQKPKHLEIVTINEEVIIKDYRVPNKHYIYLKNQVVIPDNPNQTNSNTRHSLTDEFETRLTYL